MLPKLKHIQMGVCWIRMACGTKVLAFGLIVWIPRTGEVSGYRLFQGDRIPLYPIVDKEVQEDLFHHQVPIETVRVYRRAWKKVRRDATRLEDLTTKLESYPWEPSFEGNFKNPKESIQRFYWDLLEKTQNIPRIKEVFDLMDDGTASLNGIIQRMEILATVLQEMENLRHLAEIMEVIERKPYVELSSVSGNSRDAKKCFTSVEVLVGLLRNLGISKGFEISVLGKILKALSDFDSLASTLPVGSN